MDFIPLQEIIEQYGIYAVFALCTIEGDITLLLSGVLAHSGFFGCRHFSQANAFLEARAQAPIDWALPECTPSA